MKQQLNRFTIAALTAIACITTTAGAQNIHLMRAGEVVHPDGKREYVIPSTTIVVDVTVKKEIIRTGPYARYAQRYFGTIAPLNDKDIYSITDTKIGWYDNGNEPEPQIYTLPESYTTKPASHITADEEFLRVKPDKLSAGNKSLDNAAKDAAQAVFDIRKRRTELITGEYAETVFGEGLRAAIERLDQMENDYLELFYGKQYVSYETRRFTVVPDADRNVYVACRWSDAVGLLPATDLTGQPIIMELKPQNVAATAYPPVLTSKKKDKNAAPTSDYIIADNIVCRVVEGKRELAKRTIPVYQFGIKREL